MKKVITIMDFDNEKTKIKIDNFEDVVRMNIEVVTGDEILYVLKKDYTQEEYDSGKCRMIDFCDGGYTIYDTINNINFIDAWNKRKNSYDHKWRYKK